MGQARSKSRHAFTLLELLIIVTVIAVIAAVAIPSLLAARKAGHEASAISILRQIHTAQTLFQQRRGVFASSDEELRDEGFLNTASSQSVGAGDQVLNGYIFIIQNPNSSVWFARAHPIDPGITGDRFFALGMSGLIYYNTTGPANGSDPTVQ